MTRRSADWARRRNEGYGQGDLYGGRSVQDPYMRDRNPGRGLMVNPWESGTVPGSFGAPDLRASLSNRIEHPESELALNLLNAVLTNKEESHWERERAWQGGQKRGMDWQDDQFGAGGRGILPTPLLPPQKLPRMAYSWGVVEGMDASSLMRAKYMAKKKQHPKKRPLHTRLSKPAPKLMEKAKNAGGKAGGGDAKTANDASGDKKQLPSVPKAYFCCHICNMKKFNNSSNLLDHLRSKRHKRMVEYYQEKIDSTMKVLKAQAWLKSQRQIVGMVRQKGRLTKCETCDCNIKGGMSIHPKIREHSLICHFTKCFTCKTRFNTRMELEEHKLTFSHLKMQCELDNLLKDRYERRVKKEDKECIPEQDSTKEFHDTVDEMVLNNLNRQVWNKDSIPIYDPALPVGLNHLLKQSGFVCTVCPKKVSQTAHEALEHTKTKEHYDCYLQHLKDTEKAEAERKEKEREEKEKAEKLRLEKERLAEEKKKKKEEEAAKNVIDVEDEEEKEEDDDEVVELKDEEEDDDVQEIKQDKDEDEEEEQEEEAEAEEEEEEAEEVEEEEQEQEEEEEGDGLNLGVEEVGEDLDYEEDENEEEEEENEEEKEEEKEEEEEEEEAEEAKEEEEEEEEEES